MVFFKVENSYLLFSVKFMIWARKFLNSTIVVKCEIWAVQIKDSTIVKFMIFMMRRIYFRTVFIVQKLFYRRKISLAKITKSYQKLLCENYYIIYYIYYLKTSIII